MEIRRIEPDLIAPANASDHGAEVKLPRRPQHSRQHHEDAGHHDPHPEDEEKTGEGENDDAASAIVTYTTAGQVQQQDAPGHGTHTVDTFA